MRFGDVTYLLALSLGEGIDEIKGITSNTYISVTDDPISLQEMSNAATLMKKGGWDYSLPVLNLLIGTIPTCLLHLLNVIFFFCYPMKLCLSLLHAIPNGIQMQPLLGLLYDRIIALRLIAWPR